MISLLRSILRLLFGYRAWNTEVLSQKGPVLLVPNHVSWLDWLFLGAVLDEDWRFVVNSRVAETSWLHRKIMKNRRTFPVDTESPYAVKKMASFLNEGGRLVLFAEGRLTDTGTLMKLFDGVGFLLFKTRAKVITCYLRGLNRIRWSRQPGWRVWWPRVSAHFSRVMDSPHPEKTSTTEARYELTDWLRDHMIEQQVSVEMEFGPATVPEAIVETACQQPSRVVLEDFNRASMSYRKLLTGADLLADHLALKLEYRQDRIGVLLPNANGMPATLLALWSMGKVPAILNFSTGSAIMTQCATLAGLKQIVTSRQFVEKATLDLQPLKKEGIEFIYLEDIKSRITRSQKLIAAFNLLLSMRNFIRSHRKTEEAAVILFTSGSEGIPKGVELSHRNLLANVRQMLGVMDVVDSDRVFNALPLFHSFGLTVGMLLPLIRGIYCFLYPSPLHYRIVPDAFYDRACTIFLATNTFLNGYARKGHSYDFRSLRCLFAGAEKVQEATRRTYADKYGVRILEGYGATECSPCVSVNVPIANRSGTAGKLMPLMEYRLEKVPGVEEGGRLQVKGPNVMKGYLNKEPNEEFQKLEGWYDTGDIVSVDEHGYLSVKGRLKRFAKVSGEMVSLTAVEEALAGAFPDFGLRCQIAVLAEADEHKGEKLIAVTNEPKLEVKQIREILHSKGFSNLCVPREIKTVREIPKLGTGKVDHRKLSQQLKETHE